VANHRGDAGEHSDEVVPEPASEEGSGHAFADVEKRNGDRELEPDRAPDVRRARVAAADPTDVDAGDEARQPVPPRHRAEEVAGRNEERFGQV
jgi:hypothetical protein